MSSGKNNAPVDGSEPLGIEGLHEYDSGTNKPQNTTEDILALELNRSRIQESISLLEKQKQTKLSELQKCIDDYVARSQRELISIRGFYNKQISELQRQLAKYSTKNTSINKHGLKRKLNTISNNKKNVQIWHKWKREKIVLGNDAILCICILSCYYMWKTRHDNPEIDISSISFSKIISNGKIMRRKLLNVREKLPNITISNITLPFYLSSDLSKEFRKVLSFKWTYTDINKGVSMIQEDIREALLKLKERNHPLIACILSCSNTYYPVLIDKTYMEHENSNDFPLSIWLFDMCNIHDPDNYSLFRFGTIDAFVEHLFQIHRGKHLNKKDKRSIKPFDQEISKTVSSDHKKTDQNIKLYYTMYVFVERENKCITY